MRGREFKRPSPGTDVGLSMVHAGAGSAGLEWRPTTKNAFAVYYAADYFGRNFFPDTTNTMHPGNDNWLWRTWLAKHQQPFEPRHSESASFEGEALEDKKRENLSVQVRKTAAGYHSQLKCPLDLPQACNPKIKLVSTIYVGLCSAL